jgi:hypothetical protein
METFCRHGHGTAVYIDVGGPPLEGLMVPRKYLHPRRSARAAFACRITAGVKHAHHAMLAGLAATCLVSNPLTEITVHMTSCFDSQPGRRAYNEKLSWQKL